MKENNYKCPNCASVLEYASGFGYNNPDLLCHCKNCDKLFIICSNCSMIGFFDRTDWEYDDAAAMYYKSCSNCNSIFQATKHVLKSNIYNNFCYAFKFVNRLHVPYPMYFRNGFPIGDIEQDLGDFYNDFLYADSNDELNQMMGTDFGTARAYRIKMSTDYGTEYFVALSHETGLEIFLVTAGALITADIGKFILKRTLGTVEKNINEWWEKGEKGYWDKDESNEPLVIKMQVRTPYWEIDIDGTFTQKEKDTLFELIQNNKPQENIDVFLSPLNNKKLLSKVKSFTRKITKRKKRQ
jgi:hypothetical protein